MLGEVAPAWLRAAAAIDSLMEQWHHCRKQEDQDNHAQAGRARRRSGLRQRLACRDQLVSTR